ncbi:MAG TPA: hypothetical protein VJ044_15735, partial [Candidatus Hodarchaeales archaeon]|nr:hypothetical protein [Candidatus Hodarchaeales archaeon]
MPLRRRLLRSIRRGVSPVIATIMLIGLMTIGTLIGFFQVIPFVEQAKVESGIGSVQTSFINLDSSIFDLILNGEGKRTVSFNQPSGLLEFAPGQNNYHFQLTTLGSPLNAS